MPTSSASPHRSVPGRRCPAARPPPCRRAPAPCRSPAAPARRAARCGRARRYVDAALGAPQQVAEPAQVGEAAGRVLAGGAQQDVVGLVLAQRVVDQVGAEGRPGGGLLLAGKRRSIRPAITATLRKERRSMVNSSIHASRSSPSMSSSNSWSSCALVGGREAPEAEHVVGGDEAQRLQAHALHAPGQQHAERLVRVTALEAIGDDELLAAAREVLRPAACRASGRRERQRWMSSHSPHLRRQPGMRRRIPQDAAHALGQEGRERQPAAAIGRHLGIAAASRASIAPPAPSRPRSAAGGRRRRRYRPAPAPG